MSKVFSEIIKSIGQGTLGAMTLSAYHQYTVSKIIELHNDKINLQYNHQQREINELREKIHTLIDKKKWWW
jgi:hypothetical protein